MNIENSRDYYGRVLTGTHDLKTDACCMIEAPPPAIMAAMRNVHEAVRARYYGCGLVAPQAIGGAHILDLGSGSGQDAYILAQFTGEAGSVTGVDTTPEQLAIANEYREWHREAFGYAKCNVSFVEGDLEKLADLGLPSEHYDVIVSNCVINLVADKEAVFAAAHALLKEGGELYFSDVYADRRVPDDLKDDPVLHGECLSGALYRGDFMAMAKAAGFADPRLVTSRPLEIGDAAVAAKLDGIGFHSATYRLFKLAGLESRGEDYGQAVRYRGTVPGQRRVFDLDADHRYERGRITPLCGNSWRMLAQSRFAGHFEFFGDFETHFGPFVDAGTDAGMAASFGALSDAASELPPATGSCC